jgi:hypothetical protein
VLHKEHIAEQSPVFPHIYLYAKDTVEVLSVSMWLPGLLHRAVAWYWCDCIAKRTRFLPRVTDLVHSWYWFYQKATVAANDLVKFVATQFAEA